MEVCERNLFVGATVVDIWAIQSLGRGEQDTEHSPASCPRMCESKEYHTHGNI